MGEGRREEGGGWESKRREGRGGAESGGGGGVGTSIMMSRAGVTVIRCSTEEVVSIYSIFSTFYFLLSVAIRRYL